MHFQPPLQPGCRHVTEVLPVRRTSISYFEIETSDMRMCVAAPQVVSRTAAAVGSGSCWLPYPSLIAKDLDEYGDLQEFGAWSAFGWIITKKGIEDMRCRAEKETEDQARKMEEFTECVFI